MSWDIVYKGPPATAFATLFERTENPLSEDGTWIKAGSAWQAIRSLNGYACGAAYTDAYDDAYAKVSPQIFRAPNDDYEITATVRKVSGAVPFSEIELLLRIEDAASSVNCYEMLITTAGTYQLMSWDGPMGTFHEVVAPAAIPGWSGDGDRIRARVTGSNPVTITLWHAPASAPTTFTQQFQTTDSAGTRKLTGQPGIATYQHAADANLLNAGWSDFTVVAV